MTADPQKNDLIDLAFAVCDGTATDEQIRAIEAIVSRDPAARLLYLQCLELHFEMQRGPAEGESDGNEVQIGAGDSGFDVRDLEHSAGAAVELPLQLVLRDASPESAPSYYPFSPAFVGSPLFSYIAATLIMGMLLLGAWAYKISNSHQDYAQKPAPRSPGADRQELVFVGHVTGMKNCRWADPDTQAYLGSSVPLGRKYALASGLMEISYKQRRPGDSRRPLHL